jgi:hypothetical protein
MKVKLERDKTIKKLCFLVLLLVCFASPCNSQDSTGNAETKGACSPAISGNNAQVTIKCEGINDEQAAQLSSILNKILKSQLDPEVVKAKLDEILRAVDKDPLQSRALKVADALNKFASDWQYSKRVLGQQIDRESPALTQAEKEQRQAGLDEHERENLRHKLEPAIMDLVQIFKTRLIFNDGLGTCSNLARPTIYEVQYCEGGIRRAIQALKDETK